MFPYTYKCPILTVHSWLIWAFSWKRPVGGEANDSWVYSQHKTMSKKEHKVQHKALRCRSGANCSNISVCTEFTGHKWAVSQQWWYHQSWTYTVERATTVAFMVKTHHFTKHIFLHFSRPEVNRFLKKCVLLFVCFLKYCVFWNNVFFDGIFCRVWR